MPAGKPGFLRPFWSQAANFEIHSTDPSRRPDYAQVAEFGIELGEKFLVRITTPFFAIHRLMPGSANTRCHFSGGQRAAQRGSAVVIMAMAIAV